MLKTSEYRTKRVFVAPTPRFDLVRVANTNKTMYHTDLPKGMPSLSALLLASLYGGVKT